MHRGRMKVGVMQAIARCEGSAVCQIKGSESRSLAEWLRFREASGLLRYMRVAPHVLLNNPVTARSVKWKLRVFLAAGRLLA